MSLTKFIRPILSTRLHKLDAYTSKAEILQRNVLRQLLSKSCSTEWGSAHGYAKDLSYENFARHLALFYPQSIFQQTHIPSVQL